MFPDHSTFESSLSCLDWHSYDSIAVPNTKCVSPLSTTENVTQNLYKAIVDYTSPAFCTPVTLRRKAMRSIVNKPEEDGVTDIGNWQHAQNLVKIAHVVPEISSRTYTQTDRQTDTQTDILITILRSQPLPRAK